MDYQLDKALKFDKKESWYWNLHEYGADLIGNHIYLMPTDNRANGNEDADTPDGIDWTTANRFVKNLNACMRANPEEPILIHMKTNGGDCDEGWAIFDAIRSCPAPVTILNYSSARSMSSLIFLAGNKRVMMPHSYFMFHQGTMDIGGTYKTVTSYVDFERRVGLPAMLDVYVEAMSTQGIFSGESEKKIRSWIKGQMDRKEEVFLTASETVEYGLADEIFKGNWASLTEYTHEQLDR